VIKEFPFLAKHEPERVNAQGGAERKGQAREHAGDDANPSRPSLSLQQCISRHKRWSDQDQGGSHTANYDERKSSHGYRLAGRAPYREGIDRARDEADYQYHQRDTKHAVKEVQQS